MEIPVKYLLDCSDGILGEYQLSRLNRMQILMRQARELQEQAIDNAVEAAVATWFRVHRKDLLRECSSIAMDPPKVSDNS